MSDYNTQIKELEDLLSKAVDLLAFSKNQLEKEYTNLESRYLRRINYLTRLEIEYFIDEIQEKKSEKEIEKQRDNIL